MKKKRFGLIELLALIAILFIIALFLRPLSQTSGGSSRAKRCRYNLSQMGKAYNIFLLDFGKQVRYPQLEGVNFVLSSYANKILIEKEAYQCPETTDIIRNELDNLTENKMPDFVGTYIDEGDDGNGEVPVSYAGRINHDQDNYPGIFRPTEETTTTPITSDDWNDGFDENHENGQVVQYLFLDAHVDDIRRPTADHGSQDIMDVLSN